MTSVFAATMAEWLGQGLKPDPQSQDRADICTGRLTGRPCPFNWQGGWIFPKAVAETVRRWSEIKNGLSLHVASEDKLGHCEICNCRLNLKVHVPKQTILNHTPAATLAEFATKAPWCWLNTEQNTSHEIKKTTDQRPLPGET